MELPMDLRAGRDYRGMPREPSMYSAVDRLSMPPNLKGLDGYGYATESREGRFDGPSSGAGSWEGSDGDERSELREFWVNLPGKQKRELLTVEKETFLRGLREHQPHVCSCPSCGWRRPALEKEIYDAYCQELQHFEGNGDDSGGGVLGVADELLRGNGRKFGMWKDELAKLRGKRLRNRPGDPGDTGDIFTSASGGDGPCPQGDPELERDSVDEARRTYQISLARMFERRMLSVYRERSGRDRGAAGEDAEADRASLERRENRLRKEKEKKQRKKVQRQQVELKRKEAEEGEGVGDRGGDKGRPHGGADRKLDEAERRRMEEDERRRRGRKDDGEGSREASELPRKRNASCPQLADGNGDVGPGGAFGGHLGYRGHGDMPVGGGQVFHDPLGMGQGPMKMLGQEYGVDAGGSMAGDLPRGALGNMRAAPAGPSGGVDDGSLRGHLMGDVGGQHGSAGDRHGGGGHGQSSWASESRPGQGRAAPLGNGGAMGKADTRGVVAPSAAARHGANKAKGGSGGDGLGVESRSNMNYDAVLASATNSSGPAGVLGSGFDPSAAPFMPSVDDHHKLYLQQQQQQQYGHQGMSPASQQQQQQQQQHGMHQAFRHDTYQQHWQLHARQAHPLPQQQQQPHAGRGQPGDRRRRPNETDGPHHGGHLAHGRADGPHGDRMAGFMEDAGQHHGQHGGGAGAGGMHGRKGHEAARNSGDAFGSHGGVMGGNKASLGGASAGVLGGGGQGYHPSSAVVAELGGGGGQDKGEAGEDDEDDNPLGDLNRALSSMLEEFLPNGLLSTSIDDGMDVGKVSPQSGGLERGGGGTAGSYGTATSSLSMASMDHDRAGESAGVVGGPSSAAGSSSLVTNAMDMRAGSSSAFAGSQPSSGGGDDGRGADTLVGGEDARELERSAGILADASRNDSQRPPQLSPSHQQQQASQPSHQPPQPPTGTEGGDRQGEGAVQGSGAMPPVSYSPSSMAGAAGNRMTPSSFWTGMSGPQATSSSAAVSAPGAPGRGDAHSGNKGNAAHLPGGKHHQARDTGGRNRKGGDAVAGGMVPLGPGFEPGLPGVNMPRSASVPPKLVEDKHGHARPMGGANMWSLGRTDAPGQGPLRQSGAPAQPAQPHAQHQRQRRQTAESEESVVLGPPRRAVSVSPSLANAGGMASVPPALLPPQHHAQMAPLGVGVGFPQMYPGGVGLASSNTWQPQAGVGMPPPQPPGGFGGAYPYNLHAHADMLGGSGMVGGAASGMGGHGLSGIPPPSPQEYVQAYMHTFVQQQYKSQLMQHQHLLQQQQQQQQQQVPPLQASLQQQQQQPQAQVQDGREAPRTETEAGAQGAIGSTSSQDAAPREADASSQRAGLGEPGSLGARAAEQDASSLKPSPSMAAQNAGRGGQERGSGGMDAPPQMMRGQTLSPGLSLSGPGVADASGEGVLAATVAVAPRRLEGSIAVSHALSVLSSGNSGPAPDIAARVEAVFEELVRAGREAAVEREGEGKPEGLTGDVAAPVSRPPSSSSLPSSSRLLSLPMSTVSFWRIVVARDPGLVLAGVTLADLLMLWHGFEQRGLIT
eukprot:jgi/Mesvir1/18398/Mv14276-RA.4